MKRILIVVILFSLFCKFLPAQEINENAKKYLNILKTKPTPGFMFDRFYGAWMESSDTKALEEFLKKASVDAPSSENFLLLTFYYQKEGQINQALGVFNSIDNAKLLTGEVLFYRAKLESNALNFADAIKNIDTAISLPLKEDLKQKLLKLKAQVQYRNGDSAGARKTFEVLFAINEKDKMIIEDVMEIQLSEGVYEDAKKYCQKLIDLATDNYEKVNYQLKMATILKRLNDAVNSEKIYLELINLSGQDSWLLKEVVYQFESIYRGKDNIAELIKKYEEIIKANPQNVYLRKRYSSLLSEKGEKETSINEFKAIVELLPGDRSIKEEYASLLVSNDKTEEAIKILESFASPKTGSKDYEIILRIAELQFKIKKVADAYQSVQQFLAKNDLTEYEILRVSNLVHKYDQVAKELELLEKYSKEKPDAIAIKEALVNLYLENKDKEKALLLTKSLNIKEDMDLNFRVASLFTRYKLIDEALIILESTKKENKETYKYAKRLYDIYSELKNEDKKREISNSILKVCNSFVEIREAIQLIKGLYEAKDLDILIRSLEEKKDLDFKEVLLLANLKYKTNQHEIAFKLIEDSENKFGNEILFSELKENFFSSIKEFEKAIKVVDELIKKSPKDSTKYLLLKTNLQKRAGNTDDAIASAKQLLVATNNKIDHVIMLAELYQMKGESDDAIAVLRKASFENAEEKSIKVKLADSYSYAQNYNDARRILWSLLEATEDITEKISYMDKIFNCYDYDLGVDALIENLKERKLNNIKSTFPLLALIRVYQRLNDTENKSKYMIELSQLKTDDVRLYIELADVMAKDLNYDGAETALKKAVEIDKGDLARNKLVKYYFSIDKDELAVMELLRLSNNSFKEKEIVEVAEKYISSEKYDKAYQFMKSHVPMDRTQVYDYIFAIAAREAKIENAETYFYNLLDRNEEFAKAQAVQNQRYDDKYLPSLLKKIYEFQQYLWSYASYQNKQQAGGFVRGNMPSNGIINPTNLKELHIFAIAHLGDLYRAGDENKKKEIVNELKNRNIEYPEILLMMDKNKINSGNDNTYKDLFLKDPDNVELKVLSALSDRSFFNKIDEKLMPLVSEIKEKDKNLAYWLLSTYGVYLKEIKQEVVSDLEEYMKTLNVPDDTRLNLYIMLFANLNNRPKIIADDLIEKYKPIILSLLDKSIEKDFENLRYGTYYLFPLLSKFKDAERYAKIINKQLTTNKTKNQFQNQYNYNRRSRNRNMGNLSGGGDYPYIVQQQFNNQYYELYNKNNNININEEFRKQLIPLIENKYLKLSIYHFLGNEEESAKLLKEFEESKTLDDILIVASYYGYKQKEKEAVVALNKALMLATTVDSKKSINGKIAFFASKIDDPIIKTDGVNAAKRLKNFNLSKEELLELSMLLESLGESSEAEKLDDKISKMNSNSTNNRNNYNYNANQNIGNKLETMLSGDKNDAAFKFLVSSLKINFSGFSNQMKTNAYFQFDSYSFDKIIKMIKKKNVSEEFKKFVVDQASLNEDDLVTIIFIFYKLDEFKEASVIAKKLIEKKPNDLTYKMLDYMINLKNTTELGEVLKQEIKKNTVDALYVMRNFWSSSRLFDTNRYELKAISFYILDNITVKEQDLDLYVEVFITPFLSSVNLTKNIYTESILNTRANRRDLKEDEKKILDSYYNFYEELMLKCIKNKICAMPASSSLLHYYTVNQMPIKEEILEAFSEVLIANTNTVQNNRIMNFSSNGESLLPLSISLAIYLLNQNKGAVLDVLCEKIKGDEKANYKKILDKLKIFYVDTPVKKEDLVELGSAIYNNNYYNESALIVLSQLLQKVEVKNNQVQEFLLTNLKDEFSQENGNFYMNQNSFTKYLESQMKNLKKEEAVAYLVNIEKKILPKPFDRELYEKNKNNWEHYTKKITGLFSFENGNRFNIEMYKNILFAAQSSEFYFYLSRLNNYSWKMRELSKADLLSSGLFTGKLSEMQIVKSENNSFLINEIIRKFKEDKKQETIELLGKMEQTDGVKLLTYWVEGKSYQKVFDLIGSKLSEFKSMARPQQVEWAAFVTFLYKEEDTKKQELNEFGKEFKLLVENLGNNKLEETKKKFLEGKFEEDMQSYRFLELLVEIYPSILTETEEKVLEMIKSAKRKYGFYERNHSRGYSDNYQHDEFTERIIQIDSPKKNHLIVVTELLSQNIKFPPDYYKEYSSVVRHYIKQRIYDFLDGRGIKKNKNEKYILDEEQGKSFKLELNKAIDEVVAINKNQVPIYMISFGEELGPINGKETALNELIAEWGAEKELSSLKRDIYFEFKAFMQKDKSILENHLVSQIENPAVILQIKSFYMDEALKNNKLSKEVQKKILKQQLNIIILNSSKLADNPNQFYQFIDKYEYETLKESSDELSKVVKNWYRGFEKALLESYDNEWRIESYGVRGFNNSQTLLKVIRVMKDHLDEKMINKFISSPNIGFKKYFPVFIILIKEGYENIVLDALNGNVEEIKLNLNRMSEKFLSAEDLKMIDKTIEKVTDPEKRNFAKILFYRIGIKKGGENKGLDLFVSSVKEMIKTPIKDLTVKKKIIELIYGTELSTDKDVLKLMNESVESFDENKLKTASFHEVGATFRLYCTKFSKILVGKGLDSFKIEVDKTLKLISENETDKNSFVLAISDSLSENLLLDKNIIKNSNAYFEAISHVLDSFDHADNDGKLGFNYALCLLFLDNKESQYAAYLERYSKQHFYHWEKGLSTVKAIELFKTVYLQNAEQSAVILKSINEFFSSKANSYYDYLSEDKTKNLFDFITKEEDRNQVIENYKKFNQQNKNKNTEENDDE